MKVPGLKAVDTRLPCVAMMKRRYMAVKAAIRERVKDAIPEER